MTLLLILAIFMLSAGLIVFSMLDAGSQAWLRHTKEFSESAAQTMQRLFVFRDVRNLLGVYVVAMLLVPLSLYVLDFAWVFVLLSFVIVFQFPKLYFKLLERKRAQAINVALPDALGQISGAMRAGSTFVSAVQSMVQEHNGPISQEFSLMLREIRLGARLEEAMDNLGERVQTEEMDLVICAALIAQELGGNLAEILSRLSDNLRQKMAMEGKIKSLTAQGVLQGYVVTALPFIILLALLIIEPEATQPIFSGLLGWIFLTMICFLQLVGGIVIRKIVSIDI